MNDVLEKLSAPFPPKAVRWRVGPMTRDKKRAMALAYVDARDVMDRLDAVCGSHWSCRYIPMNDGTMCCEIGISLPSVGTIWRGGGAPPTGDVKSTDHSVVEMALKGGYSDAFKRAAVLWGVGRYLYDIDSPWVDVDENKRFTPAAVAKLMSFLDAPAKQEVKREASKPSKSTEELTIEAQWKRFFKEINEAIPGGRNAVDKLIFAQSATVEGWPEKYQTAYNERTAEARSKAHQMEEQ